MANGIMDANIQPQNEARKFATSSLLNTKATYGRIATKFNNNDNNKVARLEEDLLVGSHYKGLLMA